MKKFLISILIITIFAATGIYFYYASQVTSHKSHDIAAQYQCPMHPQIIQDGPGNCPICGMRLVKIEQAVSPVEPQAQRKKIVSYRNPMDPQVTSPVPAKDAMGMDYIPVYDEFSETKLPESDVSGHAAVQLTHEKSDVIGITTAPAVKEHLILPLRLTGSVFHNHEIFELLSQYREAIQVEKRYKKPTYELVAQSRAASVAIRNKLRRFGIDDEVFKKAEESLEDPTHFVPAHLIIAANGAYVDARLPVSDLAHVRVGQKAIIHSPMAPDEKSEGILRSLDSVVDTTSQTLAVRFEVESGHEFLKPGMFVTVEMEVNLGDSLSIPNQALFNPGKNAYVFIEKEPGIYVPRKVGMGILAGARVQILKGLEAGEKVVTAANFLLDSESRFQAARSMSTQTGGQHD